MARSATSFHDLQLHIIDTYICQLSSYSPPPICYTHKAIELITNLTEQGLLQDMSSIFKSSNQRYKRVLDILKRYYGLMDIKPMSQREIADIYQLSNASISNLHCRGMRIIYRFYMRKAEELLKPDYQRAIVESIIHILTTKA